MYCVSGMGVVPSDKQMIGVQILAFGISTTRTVSKK